MSDVNFTCRMPEFHPCVPSGKNIGGKKVVDNFFGNFMKKKTFSFMFVRRLIISRTSSANNIIKRRGDTSHY